MIALGDLICWVMLALLVAALATGLWGRHLGKVLLASFALFVLSWWFPQPGSVEYDKAHHLHPFPLSLLLLMLTVPVGLTAWVVGVIARWISARVTGARRAARPNNHPTRIG